MEVIQDKTERGMSPFLKKLEMFFGNEASGRCFVHMMHLIHLVLYTRHTHAYKDLYTERGAVEMQSLQLMTAPMP